MQNVHDYGNHHWTIKARRRRHGFHLDFLPEELLGGTPAASQSMSRGKKRRWVLPVMGLAPLKTMVPKKHEKMGDLTMKDMI
jgi:hypothetical protein